MPLVMIKSDPRARLKLCLRCGYSLRNVPDARLCPECALPIWLTLGGNDDLEMSNPVWLHRLTLAAVVLALAHAVLFLGVVALHAWILATDDERYLLFDPTSVIPFVGGAYLAACGLGLMLLASEERRIPERVRGLRRATVIAGAIALAAGVWFVTPYSRWHMPTILVLLITAGQAAVGWVYLQQIARRIPSRRTAFFAQYLWIGVAIVFVSLVLRGTMWAMWVIYEPWSKPVLAWTLFLLAYPPLAMVLWMSLARRFHNARKGAINNWGPDIAAS